MRPGKSFVAALDKQSEAVRVAVREGLERLTRKRRSHPDFQQWKGRALRAVVNPRPRFQSDEDLWG